MAKKTLIGIDPKKLFDRAEEFHWTYGRLTRNTNEEISRITGIPSMVLSAFTCEIYLKCLHMIDSSSAPRGHELQILYEQLPKLRQIRIEVHWDRIVQEKRAHYDNAELLLQSDHPGATIPRDLPTALRDCSKGFEQLRYEYEDSQFRYYLGDLTVALQATILEIQPTWTSRRPDPALIPSRF